MSAFSLNLSALIAIRCVRRRGWLSRVLAAIEESRMRAADISLAARLPSLAGELRAPRDRLDVRSKDCLASIGVD